MRKIPYGTANFETIRNENAIYIDKTMYIEKLEEDLNKRKSIYLRPRRFGKSLFTSMLTAYYSVDMEDKFESLFKGLYIYNHPTKNKNNYYVLNFNFSGLTITEKNIIEEGKESFYNAVKESIRNFINRYKFNINVEGKNASDLLLNLLVTLQGLDIQHKVYIIIDEYDNFTNAMLKGDGRDFLDLVNRNGYVRAFYEVIKMKTEEGIVERFFATGVMPVTLDSLTSGFNITTNLSTDEDFTSMIGFTHEEVRAIVEEVVPQEDIEKVYETLKANYDGYKFSRRSEEKTFNSTLVMYYLSNYSRRGIPPENLLDVNMNTSGDKIRRIIELIQPQENYEKVKEIILKNEVTGKLKDVILRESYDTNDFLTMLFSLGYLTISHDDYGETVFTVPNYITTTIYSEYMAKIISENDKYKINIKDMEDAIRTLAKYGDITKVVNLVKEFLSHSSNRDMENFNEKDLKYTFVLFLSLTQQYIVYGEFPAKQGFADILVQKTSESVAKYDAIIELKYLSKEKSKTANKPQLVEDAKNQLKKYMEDKRLNQKENLKKYVIIFTGFEDVTIEEI